MCILIQIHFLIKKSIVLQSLLDFSCSLTLLLSTATIADLVKIHNTGILGWIECHIWNNELLHFGLFLSSTWNIVLLTVERYVSSEASIDCFTFPFAPCRNFNSFYLIRGVLQ